MKILLDENLPVRLRHFLPGHDVFTVRYMDWSGYKNGHLLALAAAAGFDALLTLDDGIGYQTNLETLPISILALQACSNALDDLLPLVTSILRALATQGHPRIVRIPDWE